MFKPILALGALVITIRLGLELLAGPHVLVDLMGGKFYWLPALPFRELPDLVTSITRVFPVFPLISFILMFAAGLLALAELD